MPDLKDTSVCGEPRTDGQFCPTLQHPGEVHILDDGTEFTTVPYAGTGAPPLVDELLLVAQLRDELRELRADKRWLLAHASHEQFAAFINAKRARTSVSAQHPVGGDRG